MTKFEEIYAPATEPVTIANNAIQALLKNHREWREAFHAVKVQNKELVDENKKLERENQRLVAENLSIKTLLEDAKKQPKVSHMDYCEPQQALPVVPKYVGEFIETHKGKKSICGVLNKILNYRKGYLKIYDWVFHNEENQELFALAFITGKYEVEKPQLFYLKNKLTTSYLALDINTGYYEHWGEEIIPKLLKKQGYKLSFTQQEINSMQTGSYEQIKVPVEK